MVDENGKPSGRGQFVVYALLAILIGGAYALGSIGGAVVKTDSKLDRLATTIKSRVPDRWSKTDMLNWCEIIQREGPADMHCEIIRNKPADDPSIYDLDKDAKHGK